MTTHLPLKLDRLPSTLPSEEAIKIELVEGIPLFRASQKVQSRIEILLIKQQENSLSPEEEKELDDHEELDDYLSLVNRTIRNFYIN
jgi:hypothetical protein